MSFVQEWAAKVNKTQMSEALGQEGLILQTVGLSLLKNNIQQLTCKHQPCESTGVPLKSFPRKLQRFDKAGVGLDSRKKGAAWLASESLSYQSQPIRNYFPNGY